MQKILGLDIGANSIGWTLLEIPEENERIELLKEEYCKGGKILRCGVRIFPAGKEAFGTDKEKSVAQERGKARRARNRFNRLNRRKRNLRRILFESGMLPSENPDVLERVEAGSDPDSLNPLKFRAEGLDKQLSLHDFGRAIFHICARRGFLSVLKARIRDSKRKNKTSDSEQTAEIETAASDISKKEKAESKIDILKDIQMLQDSITAKDCRHLGEYLWSLRNEYGKDYRIRKRHTRRNMYVEEFDALWEKQQSFYPEVLTEVLKKKIERELWFVRPIYWKQSTIGKCEFEPEEYCALRADRLAQEFRFYQEINNLKYWDEKDGEIRLAENPQWLEEIVNQAKKSATITFDQIREIVGLNGTDVRFNLETGKKKKPQKGAPPSEEIEYRKELKAFETDAVMRKKEYFGEGWDNIKEDEKNKIVWVLTMRPLNPDPDDPKLAFKMEFKMDENGKPTGRAAQMSDADLREYIVKHWAKHITLNVPTKDKEQDCIDNHIDSIVEYLPEEKELPKGYVSISRVAIDKMLPFMRQGSLYSGKAEKDEDAIHQAGYKRRDEKTEWTNWQNEKTGLPYLPSINEYLNKEKLTSITNPVIRRIITETRNLVNAIIRKEGRPDFTVVELARDAKNSKLKRQKIAEQNLANKAANKYAKYKIREMGEVPSDDAIERFRLWQEQGGMCPYTSIDEKRDEQKAKSIQKKKNEGRKLTKEEEQWEANIKKRKTEANACDVYSAAPISLTQLFGDKVEVDHIIPKSQRGENTMINKVLCFREANQKKGDRTPFEWLGEEKIKAVAARIRNMPMSPAKKVRLTSKTKVDPEEFTLRQMCDTQYASRYLSEYLRSLYKPEEYRNAQNKYHQRVITVKGTITARLRRLYDLNSILHKSEFKSENLLTFERCDNVINNWQTTKYNTKTLTEYLETLSDYNHDKPKEDWEIVKQPRYIALLLGLDGDYDKLRNKYNSRKDYIKKRLESIRHNTKNRGDHRHHAIDAVLIALSNMRMFARIIDWEEKNKQYKIDFPLPWKIFQPDVKSAIDEITVSHCSSGRIRGKFHEDTIYGQNVPQSNNGVTIPNKGEYVIRKNLADLTPSMVFNIKDDAVRNTVLEHLKKFGLEVNSKSKLLINEETGKPAKVKEIRGVLGEEMLLDLPEITNPPNWTKFTEDQKKMVLDALKEKDIAYSQELVNVKNKDKLSIVMKEAFKENVYLLKKGTKIENVNEKDRLKHIINKVRIVKSDGSIVPLNKTVYVKPGSTHHIALFEEEIEEDIKNSKKKKNKTDDKTCIRIPVFVTRLEANKRLFHQQQLLIAKRRKLKLTPEQAKHNKEYNEYRRQVLKEYPVIETDPKKIPAANWFDGKSHPNARFLFSLKQGETFIVKDKDKEKTVIFNSAAQTSGQFWFIDLCDARKTPVSISKRGSKLNDIVRKVCVDRIGNVSENAND